MILNRESKFVLKSKFYMQFSHLQESAPAASCWKILGVSEFVPFPRNVTTWIKDIGTILKLSIKLFYARPFGSSFQQCFYPRTHAGVQLLYRSYRFSVMLILFPGCFFLYCSVVVYYVLYIRCHMFGTRSLTPPLFQFGPLMDSHQSL